MKDFSNITAAEIGLNWAPRIAPHFRLQWEPAQDAFVLLYPEGMIKLNPSGGEILSRCTGVSIAEIIQQLREKFPDADGIEHDILDFIATAYQQHWLTHG